MFFFCLNIFCFIEIEINSTLHKSFSLLPPPLECVFVPFNNNSGKLRTEDCIDWITWQSRDSEHSRSIFCCCKGSKHITLIKKIQVSVPKWKENKKKLLKSADNCINVSIFFSPVLRACLLHFGILYEIYSSIFYSLISAPSHVFMNVKNDTATKSK